MWGCAVTQSLACHAFWRAGTWIFQKQLYHKTNIFTYGFFPPFKNPPSRIFSLSALLFLRRWCFLAVKWPSPDHARRCSWAAWCWERGLLPAGVPSSLAPLPGCCLASCRMSLYSKEPFLFICLKNAQCIFCRDIVRFDKLLSGKHPEFIGYSVYMPNFNIIFNAMIALVSIWILLWYLLLIRTALILLLLL